MDRFSNEEKLDQAIGNAIAMFVATGAFLEERGIDLDELERFFGTTHAEGWADARGDLEKIAHYVSLNMATFGFETATAFEDGGAVVSARWSADHADPDWPIPPKPALARSPVAFEPIMQRLGVGFSWEVDDDGLTMRLRESGSS